MKGLGFERKGGYSLCSFMADKANLKKDHYCMTKASKEIGESYGRWWRKVYGQHLGLKFVHAKTANLIPLVTHSSSFSSIHNNLHMSLYFPVQAVHASSNHHGMLGPDQDHTCFLTIAFNEAPNRAISLEIAIRIAHGY